MFTKHAEDRLLERFGVVLTPQEKYLIIDGIHKEAIIDGYDGEYDIKIRNRSDMALVAVVRNRTIITVLHNGNRISRKKIEKLKAQNKWPRKNYETTKSL